MQDHSFNTVALLQALKNLNGHLQIKRVKMRLIKAAIKLVIKKHGGHLSATLLISTTAL